MGIPPDRKTICDVGCPIGPVPGLPYESSLVVFHATDPFSLSLLSVVMFRRITGKHCSCATTRGGVHSEELNM
jgi:hypothetical protein